MSSETTRLEPPPHLEVETLAVELVDGDEAGTRIEACSDVVTIGKAKDNDVVLTDRAVSRYHLELKVTKGGVEVTDLGSTNGTYLGSARIERAVVPVDAVLEVGRTKLKLSDGEGTTVPLSSGETTGLIVGDSEVMQRLMAQLEKVSSSEVPCLLMGESGTGKEVIARAIQMLSKRSDGPFVTVDCGAFSPNLVASELFGHEKGAFTGADRQHVGAFERAHGGVLFLDEIGELPLDLQPQLLGALERRRFRRLGGQREIDVDVQLVSATNRDLRVEVNEGTFRLDLYYRLAVVVLRLPSLRDRRDDVPLLVEHFLRDAGHDGPVTDVVPDEIMAGLKAHRWPGNVRELRNWVEATVAMGEAGELMSHEPRGMNATADDGELLVMPYKEARFRVLEDFERRYLERLIERARHNVSAAAREARMDRSYLLKLLQRHGLR